MGKPQGPYIHQTFRLSSDGTFSVSDDHGDSYSFTIPIAAAGVSSSTLMGNSTTAVEETRVTAGPLVLADVKLTFSVYHEDCQPAGVRLVISGTEEWGAAGRGLVRVVFDKAPISSSPYRAYFGNSSGVALGFDWNDSRALAPSFSQRSRTLAYSVGPKFSIDPITVATTSEQFALNFGYDGHVFYAASRWWVFYMDGAAHTEDYISSPDGITWSSPTSVSPSCAITWPTYIGFAVSGSTIIAACQNSAAAQYFLFQSGTLKSDGSIVWAGWTMVSTGTTGFYVDPTDGFTLAIDSNGNYWVAFVGCDVSGCGAGNEFLGTAYEHTSAGWSPSVWKPTSYNWALEPLADGRMAIFYFGGSYTAYVLPYNGTSWGSAVDLGFGCGEDSSSVTAAGDTLEVSCVTTSSPEQAYFCSWTYGSTSWSGEQVASGVGASGLANDGKGNLVLLYSTPPSGTKYKVSHDWGGTWSGPFTLGSEQVAGDVAAASLSRSGGGSALGFAWPAGSPSVYDVRFAAIPPSVPTAALSTDPWSRPGLSPYESYFSEFSDYVSPGNGLVSVEVGTLDLPGRGLSFAPSLVYEQPYAFQTSVQKSTPKVANVTTGSCAGASACATGAISVPQGPVLLYATALVDGGQRVAGVASTPALSWQRRASVSLPKSSSSRLDCTASSPCEEETWYALAGGGFSGSVEVSLTGSAKAQVVVLAVTGVGSAPGSVFDPGPSAPCTGTSNSGEPSCRLSTNNPNDLVIGAEAGNRNGACSASAPFAMVEDAATYGLGSVCLEDYQASTVQSGVAVSVAAPSCSKWRVCAIVGDAVAGTTTYRRGAPYQYDNYTGADLGNGWSLNLPWLGTDYLHLTDGQAFPYSWNGSTFAYHGVEDFVLTNDSGRSYSLAMPDGTVYAFGASKQLVSITDGTGNNTIAFSYGANGYVSQVTDTIGRTVAFSYNPEGQLASISEGGRAWTLSYSGDQLAAVSDPLGRTTSFQYEGGSGAVAWLLSAVTWPTGGRVAYAYGSAPVGTEASTYYATLRDVYYDPTHLSLSQNISYAVVDGQVTWSNTTISDGTTVREHLDESFDPAGGVAKAYAYDGAGALQQVTETDSDAAGRTNATKLYSPAGALLSETVSAYDDWGNLVYSKSALGQQEWYSYANTNSSDTFGSSGCTTSFYDQAVPSGIHDLVVGSCDYQDGAGSPQQQAYYEYDGAGDLVAQKVSHGGGWLYSNFTYDSYGNQLSATNADGVTTHYAYSSAYGHAYLTKTSAAAGAQAVVTTNTYDLATGDMLSTTNPDGYATTYHYDALGRVLSVTSPAVGGAYAVTRYAYDDANNVLTTTGPDGHVTKAYYDGLGRETRVQAWNGTSVYSTAYYTYNWADKVATKTTAAGNTYAYSYDWNGRIVRLTNPDGTYETTAYNLTANTRTVTDENGHPTVYAYDRGQLLTSVREYNSSSGYYLTTYAYDLSGNMLSSTDARGQTTSYQYDDLGRLVRTTFPDGTFEAKAYDAVGNLMTRTTANGSTVSYAYDALGRLVRVSYPGSGGSVAYTYDAAGNRLSQVSPSATDYYSYDAMGRLANQTEYVGGGKYSTLYAYDNASNVVRITYPDGYALSMTYDALNRLRTVGGLATLNYTVDGQVSAIRYGDGETQSYSYDGRDRPVQVRVAYGSTVEMLLNYTYDGTGNVLKENSQAYSYDWLNRLTSASGPWGAVSYAYDSAGNRVRMVNGSATTDYAYGPFNRLASAGSINYTYDANGNTVAKSGGWAYSYDYANRLAAVSHDGVTVQRNYYDGDGNRVMQTTGGGSVVYSYQGVDILYQRNLTSGVATKSFYAGGIQVAQMVGTVVYYLHQDALGSTRLVVPASKASSFSSNYAPYGTNSMMTGEELFQYTGKLLDAATGLYYEGARYYDPTTGRFVTEDSVVGSTSDPQSLNRYVYARDNPMKIVDLQGHEWWNPVANLASAAVGDVAGEATNLANAASNAWNSLPPDVQVGTIIGVTAAVTIATAGAFAPEAAAIDLGAVSATIGSLSATEAGVATVTGAAAVTEAVPEIGPDVTTVTTTIDSGFLNGALKAVASNFDNPGPKETNSQAIGQWGQNALRPLMRLLGFTEEQYIIPTPRGNLYADFYNPITKMAIDVKTGKGSLDALQATKYVLAKATGQLSDVYYANIQNPWSGVTGGKGLTNFATSYGFKFLPLYHLFQ